MLKVLLLSWILVGGIVFVLFSVVFVFLFFCSFAFLFFNTLANSLTTVDKLDIELRSKLYSVIPHILWLLF